MNGPCYQCHSFMIFSSKQNITFEHGLIYRAKFSKYAKFDENPLQSDEKLKQDPKQGSEFTACKLAKCEYS